MRPRPISGGVFFVFILPRAGGICRSAKRRRFADIETFFAIPDEAGRPSSRSGYFIKYQSISHCRGGSVRPLFGIYVRGMCFARNRFERFDQGEAMLADNYKRGFTEEQLKTVSEPRVKYDTGGFYIMTISENVKVYFEDFYGFLELTYDRCMAELAAIEKKLSSFGPEWTETTAFYTADRIILQIVAKNIRSFYTDGSNYGVIMTPWCFGTVMLEKVEVYRDRLGKGQVADEKIPDNPYYVVRYMDEIYRKTLLDLFEFPEEAFKMRWQYSELLKRYSKVLQNITGSLQSVMMMIKSYGV